MDLQQSNDLYVGQCQFYFVSFSDSRVGYGYMFVVNMTILVSLLVVCRKVMESMQSLN